MKKTILLIIGFIYSITIIAMSDEKSNSNLQYTTITLYPKKGLLPKTFKVNKDILRENSPYYVSIELDVKKIDLPTIIYSIYSIFGQKNLHKIEGFEDGYLKKPKQAKKLCEALLNKDFSPLSEEIKQEIPFLLEKCNNLISKNNNELHWYQFNFFF